MDYLCVPARKRNGGTGSALLKAAIAHYPPNMLDNARVHDTDGVLSDGENSRW